MPKRRSSAPRARSGDAAPDEAPDDEDYDDEQARKRQRGAPQVHGVWRSRSAQAPLAAVPVGLFRRKWRFWPLWAGAAASYSLPGAGPVNGGSRGALAASSSDSYRGFSAGMLVSVHAMNFMCHHNLYITFVRTAAGSGWARFPPCSFRPPRCAGAQGQLHQRPKRKREEFRRCSAPGAGRAASGGRLARIAWWLVRSNCGAPRPR